MFFKNYIKDCLCVDKHHDGLWHGEEDRFVYSIHPFPLTHLKITCVLYLKKNVFISVQFMQCLSIPDDSICMCKGYRDE